MLREHGVARLALALEDDEGLAARPAVLGRDDGDVRRAPPLEEVFHVVAGDAVGQAADADDAAVGAVAPLRAELRPPVRLGARRREDLDVAVLQSLPVPRERDRLLRGDLEAKKTVAAVVVDEDGLLVGEDARAAEEEAADVAAGRGPREAPEPHGELVGARGAAARRRALVERGALVGGGRLVEAHDARLRPLRVAGGGLGGDDAPGRLLLLLLLPDALGVAGLAEDGQGLVDGAGHQATPRLAIR